MREMPHIKSANCPLFFSVQHVTTLLLQSIHRVLSNQSNDLKFFTKYIIKDVFSFDD